MKRFLLAAAAIGGLFTGVTAQHVHHPGCGTHLNVALENDDFVTDFAAFNAYVQQYAQQAESRSGELRIMPVVVHVIHDGGASNISDATINTMITKMNQAYNRNAPNIGTLPQRFDTIATDAKIEFRLAAKDPLGNCTNGIRRIYSPHKSKDAYDDKKHKSLSYWDRAKYLNIWITRNIKDPSETSAGQILGYCLFPGTAPALRDGATIAYQAMTTNAVAAHEIGHHLNLIHVWGDQTCGDDQVDDTPIARDVNFAWANPCDTLIKEATCYENVIDNYRDSLLRYGIGENYQNYMDYVNNYNCPNMFTKGQVDRMNATLEFYPFRKNVVTEANVIAAGVNDGAPACTNLIPVAEFWAENPITCPGSSVSFKDGSFNGTPASYEWTFEGGTPATSTVANPTVTYANPGTYSVTLKVSNANGEFTTRTKQNVVFILNDVVESKPWGYYEGFESGQYWDQGRWTVVNDQTENGKQWKIGPDNIAYSGFYSIKMDNFGNTRDNNSALISPPLDLDAIQGGSKVFKFKVAYALRTNEQFYYDMNLQMFMPVVNDRLTLSRSTNCGATWSTVKNFTRTEILSGGLSPESFNPTDLNLWKELSVNLSGASGSGSDVRFKLEFTSGGDVNNNLFIDDIIISTSTAAVSIDEATVENLEFKVYPNPVTDNAQITFTLPEAASKANIGVYDITGRFVANVFTGELPSGSQNFTLNRSELGAGGVYFVRMDLNGKSFTEKIIVQ